jgi:hypothetical protein
VLLPLLLEEITKQVDLDDTISEVILTGHSAGGAVSSLIFLHLVCKSSAKFSSLKFSLATFGSAPVISTDIIDNMLKRRNVGLILAFVNEYDIVPRADRSYVRSIVDLYRSRYGLGSVTTPSSMTSLPKPTSSEAALQSETDSLSNSVMDKIWPLPQPTYRVVGEIVILQSTALSKSIDLDPSAKTVRAVKVSSGEFSNLLFCDLGVHKRRIYLQRLELLTSSHGGRSPVDVPDLSSGQRQ